MIRNRTLPALAAVAVVTLLILGVVLGSWFQVDDGERGVVLRNGAFTRVAEPGLGFKIPFIDSVRDISVRDWTFTFKEVETYSYDQQPAHLTITVISRVPPNAVGKLYRMYGSRANLQTQLIERKVIDETKKVFGQFTAMNAVQHRRDLVDKIEEAVRQTLEEAPMQLVGIQVEDISFSNVYKKSIEDRMLAEVEIETRRQQKITSQITADMQVIKATGEANSRRQQYEAEADGIKLRGNAEAEAIYARAKALAENTNLVSLNAVEKWNGVLPTHQVPGTAVPFLNLEMNRK
jgi:regulator of protease activity HflC (stomatin/prohibitin superfamily)